MTSEERKEFAIAIDDIKRVAYLLSLTEEIIRQIPDKKRLYQRKRPDGSVGYVCGNEINRRQFAPDLNECINTLSNLLSEERKRSGDKHYWICSWDNYTAHFSCIERDLNEDEVADYKRRGFSVFDNKRAADDYYDYRMTD